MLQQERPQYHQPNSRQQSKFENTQFVEPKPQGPSNKFLLGVIAAVTAGIGALYLSQNIGSSNIESPNVGSQSFATTTEQDPGPANQLIIPGKTVQPDLFKTKDSTEFQKLQAIMIKAARFGTDVPDFKATGFGFPFFKTAQFVELNNLSTVKSRVENIVYYNKNKEISKSTISYFNNLLQNCRKQLDTDPSDTLHFVSVRKVDGQYILTYSNLKDGKIAGYAETFKNTSDLKEEIKRILPLIKETKDPTLFFSADKSPVASEIISMLDNDNINVYKRNEVFTKSYIAANKEITSAKKLGFQSSSITFINGIPQNTEQILNSGFSQQDKESLINCSKFFTTKLTDSKQVNNKESMLEELKSGSQDILLLVAHSDKLEIFLGGQRISMEELKVIKGDPKRKRPKTAYLFSCNTGELNQTAGFWVNKPVSSLSEILINNDIVDIVVAPAHEISINESQEVLNQLIEGKSIKDIRKNVNAGWSEIAQLIDNHNHHSYDN